MNTMELCGVFNVFPTFSDAATWPYGCVWKWILPNSINSHHHTEKHVKGFSQHVQRMVVYGSIPIFGARIRIMWNSVFQSIFFSTFQGEIIEILHGTTVASTEVHPSELRLSLAPDGAGDSFGASTRADSERCHCASCGWDVLSTITAITNVFFWKIKQL